MAEALDIPVSCCSRRRGGGAGRGNSTAPPLVAYLGGGCTFGAFFGTEWGW